MRQMILPLFLVILLVVPTFPLSPQGTGKRLKKEAPKRWPVAESEAVWRASDEVIREIRNKCASVVGRKACLISNMKAAGAPTQALTFSDRLQTEAGYLVSFDAQGPVDVGKVFYPFRTENAEVTMLVNGKPPIIDLSGRAFLNHLNLRRHKLYQTLIKRDRKARIWVENPTEPAFQPGIKTRTEVEVRYPIKSCQSCQAIGIATVVFDFEHTGIFLGARLTELTEGDGAAVQHRE